MFYIMCRVLCNLPLPTNFSFVQNKSYIRQIRSRVKLAQNVLVKNFETKMTRVYKIRKHSRHTIMRSVFAPGKNDSQHVTRP